MGFGLFPGLPGGSPGLPLPLEAEEQLTFAGSRGQELAEVEEGKTKLRGTPAARNPAWVALAGGLPSLSLPPPTPQWGVDPEFHSEGWCACQVLSPGTSGSGPMWWRIHSLSPRDDSGEPVRSTPLARE